MRNILVLVLVLILNGSNAEEQECISYKFSPYKNFTQFACSLGKLFLQI